MAKRVKYLHYLLNLNENDLVRKIFEAQLRNPANGDWVLKVQEDLEMLGFETKLDEIKSFKKQSFKNLVKNKINSLALNYLKSLKEGHSKMTNLKYENLEIQTYLTSAKIWIGANRPQVSSPRHGQLSLTVARAVG